MLSLEELIKEYSGEDIINKNYVDRATAKFMEGIANNIHSSNIPVQLHEEIIHNMKRTIIDNGDEIEAHVYFDGPYKESIVNPSIKASMTAVYNDVNVYYKTYKREDRTTWISYYGYERRRHKNGYNINRKGKIYMILNTCYGKGALFIENTIDTFKKLYPEVEVRREE